VALTSKGTNDPDGDALRYEWTITGPKGTAPVKLAQADPSYTFTRPGLYTASLAVTDAKGARTTQRVEIVAGNEPPVVALDLDGGNRTFFFPNTPIHYTARVTDREDGSLADGKIAADRVVVTAEYLKDGIPDAAAAPAAGHRSPGAADPHAAGKALVAGSDCLACHQVERKSIGPAYTDVAKKYRGDVEAMAKLVKKVRNGGSGVWGDVMMPPHPQVTDAQAQQMVSYVLSLGPKKSGPSLPPKGDYAPPAATNGLATGAVVLRAEYTDNGANGLPGAMADKTLVLRAPTIVLATGHLSDGVSKMQVPQFPVPMTMPSRSGGSVKLEQIDLTGISEVVIAAVAPAQYTVGGKVEVRIDSESGPLLGETPMLEKTEGTAAPPAQLHAALKPTTGAHDVYFVFKNDQAKGVIMIGLTATFVNGTATPVPAPAPASTGGK